MKRLLLTLMMCFAAVPSFAQSYNLGMMTGGQLLGFQVSMTIPASPTQCGGTLTSCTSLIPYVPPTVSETCINTLVPGIQAGDIIIESHVFYPNGTTGWSESSTQDPTTGVITYIYTPVPEFGPGGYQGGVCNDIAPGNGLVGIYYGYGGVPFSWFAVATPVTYKLIVLRPSTIPSGF